MWMVLDLTVTADRFECGIEWPLFPQDTRFKLLESYPCIHLRHGADFHFTLLWDRPCCHTGLHFTNQPFVQQTAVNQFFKEESVATSRDQILNLLNGNRRP